MEQQWILDKLFDLGNMIADLVSKTSANASEIEKINARLDTEEHDEKIAAPAHRANLISGISVLVIAIVGAYSAIVTTIDLISRVNHH